MNRYEEADEGFVTLFLDILEERFPDLQQFKIKLIYDLKQRISKGKLVLATIELAGPKLRFFTRDKIAMEGYDYIMIMDKKAWELSAEKDRKRIISHELRHVFIDEKGTPKLVGHEIEDFYAEIRLNEDDPEWRRKVATLVRDVYEQEKLMLKPKKKGEDND